MARGRKSDKNIIERAFSNNERAEYATRTNNIKEAQNQADGLARTIAANLSRIKDKELFLIEGYSNIYDYASRVHGIARGTTSEAINVYKRFQNPQNKEELLPAYANYAFRTLTMIKTLDDNTINSLGINSSMSSTDVKQRVADYKAVQSLLPEKFTYDDVKQLIENADKITEQSEQPEQQEQPEQPVDDIPNVSTMTDSDRMKAMVGEDAYNEYMEKEREAQNGEIDENALASEYIDNHVSFPTRTISIGELTNKELLNQLATLLDGVRNGDYNIVITE